MRLCFSFLCVRVGDGLCDSRTVSKCRGIATFVGPNKKPRGVSGGANFSFLSKEVTANKVVGYRNIIIMDLDLLFFVVIVLLASKSFTAPF